MVTSSERDADESCIALDRDVGDRRQRAVASGDPQDLRRRGPCKLRRVLSFPQDVRLNAEGPSLGGELAGSRRAGARTGIDQKEGGQGRPE
jgi:hypothetical protein